MLSHHRMMLLQELMHLHGSIQRPGRGTNRNSSAQGRAPCDTDWKPLFVLLHSWVLQVTFHKWSMSFKLEAGSLTTHTDFIKYLNFTSALQEIKHCLSKKPVRFYLSIVKNCASKSTYCTGCKFAVQYCHPQEAVRRFKVRLNLSHQITEAIEPARGFALIFLTGSFSCVFVETGEYIFRYKQSSDTWRWTFSFLLVTKSETNCPVTLSCRHLKN